MTMARLDRARVRVWAAGGVLVMGLGLGYHYFRSREGQPTVVTAAPAAHVEADAEETLAVGTLQLTKESM
jgi:hypothetical protein